MTKMVQHYISEFCFGVGLLFGGGSVIFTLISWLVTLPQSTQGAIAFLGLGVTFSLLMMRHYEGQ